MSNNVIQLFEKIIRDCNELSSDEEMVVKDFGKGKDLTLYIHKDCDFDGHDYCNIVTISTRQSEKYVDDTGDIYVTDGQLFRELQRIYNYKNFRTL